MKQLPAMSAPSASEITPPDPELFSRITGAVTAAEAGEGFRAFQELLASGDPT